MSCFLAPMTEAAVLEVVTAKKHKEDAALSVFSQRLGRLKAMLWSGSALLVAEHIANGEIVGKFPFLTALSEPALMLKEIFLNGTTISLLITGVWMGTCLLEKYFSAKSREQGQ